MGEFQRIAINTGGDEVPGLKAVRQAALQTKFRAVEEHRKLAKLLKAIIPALDGINRSDPQEIQWLHAVKANVRWAVRQLAETPGGRAGLAAGRIQIVGAMYELGAGRVRFLNGDNGQLA
jgi:carbonic anhydrase